MKITEMFETKDKTIFSFEVFPPKKTSPIESVYGRLEEICALGPDFISVTYGAGGNGAKGTVALASDVQNRSGITALAHLTCVGSSKADVASHLAELKDSGSVPK